MYPLNRDTDSEAGALARRLEEVVDGSARRKLLVPSPNTITDLVRKNKADTGFFVHELWGLADLLMLLRERQDELKDQEQQYWNRKSRPPNYYARAIALRLARLYAREKGARPTFGTARDGGHPSTRYGRALETIFVALEIKGGVKHAAKWAIDQLTEDDLRPAPLGDLLGGFGALGALPENALRVDLGGTDRLPERRSEAIAKVATALTRDPGK
jgi:hypothetical protein